ncbi:unnamed protein product [Cunninghamella blakesleeana]
MAFNQTVIIPPSPLGIIQTHPFDQPITTQMSDNSHLPHLTWGNVLIASTFFIIDFAISIYFNMKLTKPLIISALRCLVQLTLMGYVLEDLFKQRNPYYVAAMTFILILLSTGETVFNKSKKIFHGLFGSVFISSTLGVAVMSVLGIKFAIHQEPFWEPVVFIPTIGLILGVTTSTMAMAINQLTNGLSGNNSVRVETYLALGATRWEASKDVAKESSRLSMLPNIQRMSIAGLITIPGAMAGQIIGGADILNSVYYQQILLFMITACSGLTVMILTTLTRMILLDQRHRLRKERIHQFKKRWRF